MAEIDPESAVSPEGAMAPSPSGAAATTPAPVAAQPAGSREVRILLVAVAVLAILALVWPRGASAPAPGGFLVDAGGRPVTLADQMAPVTLLHFYASWCPPCVHEAPALARLAGDLAGDRRFRIVLVAVQDDVRRAQELAGTPQVLFDPRWETAHRYGTSQLPESYLLVDGKLVRKFPGPVEWDDAQVRESVQRAIASLPAR